VNAQDTLTQSWTGKAPEFTCPQIAPIQLPGDKFAPGVQVSAEVTVTSARPLRIEWVLARESDDRKNGGDAERAPTVLGESVTEVVAGKAILTIPQAPGAYRLFVYARDDKGGAATANTPFLVEAK
jgi:hypothetical protein